MLLDNEETVGAMLITDERWYSEIADAIRTLAVCDESYTPSQMADAIMSLSMPTNMTHVADFCAEHKIVGLQYVIGRDASFITSSFLSGNDNVVAVKFPRVTSIYDDAFHGCTSLVAVSFPRCGYIGSRAFNMCPSISIMAFPYCSTIGNEAFAGCTGLKVASLPVCSSIGSSAFLGCTSLMSLYLTSVTSVAAVGANAFQSTPMTVSAYTGAYGSIYVPESLYSRFTVAYQWMSMSSRFAVIDE